MSTPWHRETWKMTSPITWTVMAALGVATVIQCTLLLHIRKYPPLEPLGELNGLFPQVGSKIVRFVEEPDFHPLDLWGRGWEDVMPQGSGFIIVPESDQPNLRLPPPIISHGHKAYNVAVFHQLHCLHALADEINGLMAMVSNETSKGTKVGPDNMLHIEHCLAYLRNSLMCCGDTAFEGQSTITDLPATSGYGSYHVCKDFDRIMELSAQHRLTDMFGYGPGRKHG